MLRRVRMAEEPGLPTGKSSHGRLFDIDEAAFNSNDDSCASPDIEVDDDVGEEEPQAADLEGPFAPRSASEYPMGRDASPSPQATQGAAGMLACGDPRRFAFLLSELASEYALVSGHAADLTMSGSETKLGHHDVHLSGPKVAPPKLPRSENNSKNSSSTCANSTSHTDAYLEPLESATAKWERLTRSIVQMQSSNVFEIRDIWYSKSRGHSMEEYLEVRHVAAVSTVSKHDVMNLMWLKKRTGAWRHRRRESSFVATISKSALIMHPDSAKYLVWAFMGILFVLMDILFLSMSVFDIQRPFSLIMMDCVYWSLDLLASFFLGYRERDDTIMNFRKIARRYLRTWFTFDLLLMTAGWCFAFLEGVSGSEARLLRYFRLFRLMRLFHMPRFARTWQEVSLRFQSDMGTLLFKVVVTMTFVGIWIHLGACLFFWIGSDKVVLGSSDDSTPELSYILSVHWAASQLQGGVDIYPSFNFWDRVFVVLNLLGSIAVLALVVSRITTLLGAIQAEKNERNTTFNTARRFVDLNGIRTEVALEVYRYLSKRRRYQARLREMASEAELFSHLPFQLRRRLLEEARRPQLKDKLVFVTLGYVSKQFQTQLLCDVLQNVVHLPDHLIFSYGSICSRVYLLTSGEGHYTRYAKTFAALLTGESAVAAGLTRLVQSASTLQVDVDDSKSSTSSPGAFQMFEDRHRQLQGGEVGPQRLLAEMALWTCWLHKGDLEAIGEVTLFTIKIAAFAELVAQFSSIQQNFRSHAHRVVAFLTAFDEPSDLLTSEDVMAESTGRSSSAPRSWRASMRASISREGRGYKR